MPKKVFGITALALGVTFVSLFSSYKAYALYKSDADELSCRISSGTKPTPTTKTWYFSNNYFWSAPIYIYYWIDGQPVPESWPGVEMTWDSINEFGEDVYRYELDNKYNRIIFTNNSVQTVNIELTGSETYNGFYVTGDNSPYSVETWTK